jgi:DNA-binding NarL/FixJ family response regulator
VEGFDLLPSCENTVGLAAQMASSKPEVLLLDLNPEVTFSFLSDLKQAAPETSIVLWVTAISTELAFQAMGLGIRGVLRKQLPAELQVKCLQRVHAGELWFEKGLTDSFLSARRVVLTNREGQLVSLLSQGMKNKEIAATLMVSEGTVKVYLSRLFEKAGVKDRFELALFGLRNLTTGQQPAAPSGQSYGRRSVRGLRSLLMTRREAPVVEVQPRLAAARSPIT